MIDFFWLSFVIAYVALIIAAMKLKKHNMYSLILLQALFGKEGKGGGFAVEKYLAVQ